MPCASTVRIRFRRQGLAKTLRALERTWSSGNSAALQDSARGGHIGERNAVFPRWSAR